MPRMDPIARHFLQRSAWQLRDYLFPRLKEAALRLDDSQVWHRPGTASNSVGNLLLHLSGNVRQHVIAGFGGAPDVRDRPSEFAATGGLSREELLRRLEDTVREAGAVLDHFDAARLLEKTRIQGKEVVYLDDLYHVVEHFAYHTGQVIQAVKAMTGSGFPWYRHLDP